MHPRPPSAGTPESTCRDRSEKKENASVFSEQAEAMNQAGIRIQQLVERLEAALDPANCALFQECIESILDFYGHGLSRVLRIASEADENNRPAYNAIVQDTVLRGLLLIHDLHPSDLETRLRDALNRIRPYLESHGGNVELIALEGDVARLRLQGACKSCASSAVTLDLAVRNAIEEACPELSGFEVEGLADLPAPPEERERPLDEIRWTAIEEAFRLEPNEGLTTRAGGVRLVVVRTPDNFYAYRNNCPACNMPLDQESLANGTIGCRLGHRYSLYDAGRSIEQTNLHLEPFPLLVEEQIVKVAVPGGVATPAVK
jgi:Fe-S cluster biogenesis protein NfuA/nitrite reductase/ring-hydroxylating ferredoxin subunit